LAAEVIDSKGLKVSEKPVRIPGGGSAQRPLTGIRR
jgi:hypothetical protein